MAERLLVVGGDAAGMAAASQARRRRDPDDLEIVAFERGTVTSYSACGIPYWIGGSVEDRESLIARAPETFRDEYDIGVHLRHEVIGIDPDAATITVVDLDGGGERTESYDQLVIATGANPIRPDLPGIDTRGIHGVQTLDDGQRILEECRQRQPSQAVIVGGGYIGLEMAEALLQRGMEVHVVEAAPQPMTTLDPDMGEMITEAMRDRGMTVHLDCPVEAFQSEDDWVSAVITAEGSLSAGIVILGLGARPSVELARDAGLRIGPAGGIVTDPQQRTGTDGIWAAGDCTETFHRISRRPVAFALGTIANKQGRIAGVNLGGGYATFPGVVGTAVTKVCDTEIARTGLNEREATDAGIGYVTATVTSTTRAGYFGEVPHLTMKVLAERGTGRLLGAQIVGDEGTAKRIDVFATALWNDMLVQDLLNVDLSYAPPFGPVWDPVLIAARKAWDAVEEDLPYCS